jgi:hypothetical protein
MAPSPLDKLVALAATQIAQIHAAPGSAAWVRAMEAALVKAHTAAGMVGISQRTGVEPRGLSKAERADIKRAVAEQLPYLQRFAKDAGDMTPEAVAARAAMYASAIKATYGEARYPGLPFYPTQGSECMVNCKCSWRDDGQGAYTWVLSAAEHCTTCKSRAEGSPYQAKGVA